MKIYNSFNRYLSVFLLFGTLAVLNSCQKEDSPDLASEVETYETSKFFIDDETVSESYYNLKQENLILHEVHKVQTIDGMERDVVEYHGFSSEDKYFAFGETLGLSLREDLAFQEAMRKYAEESGAIEEYDRLGIIPQHFLDYETSMYQSTYKDIDLAGKRAAGVTMFENYNDSPDGSQIFMVQTYAFMPPGWKDRVACVEFVGLGGSVQLFRKTLYRQRTTTITNLGFKKINLYGSAYKSTRSAFKGA